MTELEIWNAALSRLGQRRLTSTTVAPTDRSSVAADAAWTVAVDDVLRSYAWPNAIRRSELVEVTDIAWAGDTAYVAGDLCIANGNLYECDTSGTSDSTPGATGPTGTGTDIEDFSDSDLLWNYVKAVPENLSDYTYQYLIPDDMVWLLDIGEDVDFLLEGGCIYSDTEDAVARYTSRDTVEAWDMSLCIAITKRMAWEMAFEISNQPQQAQALMVEYAQYLAAAKMSAGKEQNPGRESPERWEDVS